MRFALAALLLLLACAPDAPTSPVDIPSWAKVAPEQIAEAEKHGVPVAFENELGMRFVLIPAGTFLMGSPEEETKAYVDVGPATSGHFPAERPQHEVTLTKPFYISIYEVTNVQYRWYEPEHNSQSLAGRLSASPATGMSWEDAVSYSLELGKIEAARTYRLPTEAQWEYACRGGTTSAYFWGDDEAVGWKYANALFPLPEDTTNEDLLRDPRLHRLRLTTPVGRFLPNPWGLYDVSGNAEEFCLDAYRPYSRESSADPLAQDRGERDRTIRGGECSNGPETVRSAARVGHPRDLEVRLQLDRLPPRLAASGAGAVGDEHECPRYPTTEVALRPPLRRNGTRDLDAPHSRVGHSLGLPPRDRRSPRRGLRGALQSGLAEATGGPRRTTTPSPHAA